MYNATVLNHFENPRHTGQIDNPDGVASVGNPACGDMMKLFIRIEDGRIAEIKYKTFGCAAAIATSSAAAELVLGKTIEEALGLTKEDIVAYLDGLPAEKIECSTLAPQAIRRAIADYRARQS
ncbi:MAG: iron-sulfur cluster assembly scaffold protein [bacterium]